MPTISDTSTLTIPAGEVHTFVNETGVSIDSSATAFTLNGTVSVTQNAQGAGDRAIGLVGSGLPPLITIGPAGVLSITSSVGGVYGVYGSGERVVNQGQISVTGADRSYGLLNATSVDNSGTLTVNANGIAEGVQMQGAGNFTNSGHITVTGTDTALAVDSNTGGVFVNTGTIEAVATGPSSNPFTTPTSFAVGWGFLGSVTNSGLIKGDTALSTTVATINNSGQLIGNVTLGTANDFGNANTLTNTGTITGTVDMFTGDDTYAGTAGVLRGALHGGDGNDLILGGAGAETLGGDAGNDTIEGGGGADVLDGGAGTNLLSFAHAAAGVSVNLATGQATGASVSNFQGLVGSAFGDNLTGTGGADSLAGGAGADTLAGSGGGDTLDGGAGQDLIVTGGGNARIVIAQGESGADPAHADAVQDWSSSDSLAFAHAGQMAGDFLAASAADFASAQTLANAAIGAGSKNFVAVQVGADVVVFADSGNDNGLADDAVVLKGRVLADISVANLGALPPTPALPTSLSAPVEPAAPGVAGTGAHGSIFGNMDAAHLNDLFPAIFTAASGTEIAAAGSGGLGFDLTGTGFTYDANDLLVGGFASHFTFTDVTAAGATVLQLNLSLPNLFVGQFETWLAFDQTQLAFQTVLAGSDVIAGGSGADLLHGYAGADLMSGGGGSDSLFGGDGNDVIYAGLAPGAGGVAAAGSTFLRGELGDDYITGGTGFDDINGNQGNDTIDGGSGGDDWLVGGQGNDLIYAHAGRNILYGNLGSDTLVAGSGGDLVRGGQADDMLFGGAGTDWLSGDRGNDTITGGGGADIFHTSPGVGIDRVLDFNLAEGDRVQVDPGTVWTVTQVGADTVIDMGNGDQMTLVNVQASTLTGNWIFGA
jgi:Ca2+-binding RTX toxin-like protein